MADNEIDSGGGDEYFKNPPPPNESTKEKVVVNENICVEVPWSECFQSSPENIISPLVNLSNDDCLLLLFNYLTLTDAFHLGCTSRRLYHYFKASCRARQSLILINGTPNILLKCEEKLTTDVLTLEHILSRQPLSQLLYTKRQFSTKPLRSFESLFASLLPNLTSLEWANCISLAELSKVLTFLNTLPKLVTLKLYISINFYANDNPYRELDKFDLSRLSALKHLPELSNLSALKHLTLCMRDDRKIDFELKHDDIYNDAFYQIHHNFFLLCHQLSTFRFFSNGNLLNLFPLLRQYVLPNTKLTTGSSLMIAHYNICDEKNTQLVIEEKDKETFSYITFFGFEKSLSSLKYFPQMINLQKVCIRLPSSREALHYPTVLTALSQLPHLKTIDIRLWDNYAIFGGHRWSQQIMPVLPKVSELFIEWSTYVHDDIVDQLQLKHCFPKVKFIRFRFQHHSCIRCTWPSDDSMKSQFQVCAPKLVQSLVNNVNENGDSWLLGVKKEIQFVYNHKIYSSVENLINNNFFHYFWVDYCY